MHLPDSKIAAYPEYIQESTGGGSFDSFPAINDVRGQMVPNAPLRLGQIVFDKKGYGYQYVRLSGTCVQGDVLKMAANSLGTVQAADATSDNIHSVIASVTGITVKNQEHGNWLFFPAAGLSTVRRHIKGNSITSGGNTRFDISVKDNRVGRGGYDADAPAAAIAAGVLVQLHRPHVVSVGGVADFPVGVARHSCASGDYTLVGIHGVFLTKVDGTTNAVADGDPLQAAASGVLIKATAGGTIGGIVGVAKGAQAVAAATLAPVYLNLFGRW